MFFPPPTPPKGGRSLLVIFNPPWGDGGYFILDIASINASTEAVIISTFAENP
jgi:hypothetical protein